MSKLISVKSDGSLSISVESQLLENVQKAHTWYTNKYISALGILSFTFLDIVGFKQILDITILESELSRVAITAALTIAFDVAPLYIGYALCLKSYKLGKSIHNWILGFSTIACFLGIIGNVCFRVMTMDTAYQRTRNPEYALPITVLMCLLPIITSLVNLTIGCLSFDPLLFDMLRLSKRICRLNLRKRQIEAYLEEFSNEGLLKKELEDNEDQCYQSAKNEIYALQNKLKAYVVAKLSKPDEE